MEPGSIGLGTYLGRADEAGDEGYAAAASLFSRLGGDAFDTAANYRGGRSERVLGEVFKELPRASFFVSTKAGYLPMGDGLNQESPQAWFERVLAGPGILSPDEVIDGCHAMTPRYLSHQLEISRRALGVDRIDCFHLHNPEQQRPVLGPEAFREALRLAFEACESFASEGRIGAYGCATWNGFRVPPHHADHLELQELIALAEDVGGRGHHFKWIQLPLNLAMPEAFMAPTQSFDGRPMTALEAARRAGLRVQASASLMQAKLLPKLPRELLEEFGCRTPAQAALQFTRSCPGVTTALVGMGRPEHALENSEVLAMPRLEGDTLGALFA